MRGLVDIPSPVKVLPFREYVKDAKGASGLRLNLHEGQIKVWDSKARYVVFLAGCVEGDTVIDNPYGPPRTIRELATQGQEIVVWSLTEDGLQPCRASAPFLKGVAPLYKLTTTSGRYITVTAEHRLLASENNRLPLWVTVDELLQLLKQPGNVVRVSCGSPQVSATSHPQSTPERAPSVRPGGDRCSCTTIQDSPKHYYGGSHLCDGRPPRVPASALDILPSQTGVAEYICWNYEDVLGNTQGCNHPCQSLCHPPTHGIQDLLVPWNHEGLIGQPSSCEWFPRLVQVSDQSCRYSALGEPEFSYVRFLRDQNYVSSSLVPSASLLYMKWDEIESITPVGRGEFFDLSVPIYENYLAHGMIHHNSQSGKTVLGPHWLEREIRAKGPGDYLAGTSTFPLMNLKMLPEYKLVFQDMFHYGEVKEVKGTRVFRFWREKDAAPKRIVLFKDSEYDEAGVSETRIIFFSGTNPESMESATAKAAHIDEAGQKQFRRQSWEAVNRRLALSQGRILITTTPYGLGWLKNEIYDPWAEGKAPDIDIIQVDSIVNPAYPMAEYQKQKDTLPDWKFQMFCRGQFARPAGLIYDCFDPATHIVGSLPSGAQKGSVYVGNDFGTSNMAALFLAQDQDTGYFYVFDEYCKGGLATHEHVVNWQEMTSGKQVIKRIGGSHQEEGWRGDFTKAGWRIDEPTQPDVEAGIQKVYSLFKAVRLFVVRSCSGFLDEVQGYSRELDDSYQPTEKIEDKSRYHLLDCLRYICSDFDSPGVRTANRYKAIPTYTGRGYG